MIRRTKIELKCSFCGRTARQCKLLITDGPPKPAICDKCIDLAHWKLLEWRKNESR